MMDNEVRPVTRLIFYHTWDNEPFPKFNMPWYSACDEIVMLSHYSYELMKSGGLDCQFIPHGMDPPNSTPRPDVSAKSARGFWHNPRVRVTTSILFIFYNNRNIWRKRPGDVMNIFREFSKRHPDVMLLMNTAPVDRDGTDLIGVLNDVNVTPAPIIFKLQSPAVGKTECSVQRCGCNDQYFLQ